MWILPVSPSVTTRWELSCLFAAAGGQLSVAAAIVIAAPCQAQSVAVDPNDPQVVAAVEAILDKAVAAAAAVDADGVLASSTRDDTFTFLTGDTMLKGYDEALAAFRETYALLKGQTNQIIEKRGRVLSPDVVLVATVSEGARDRTGPQRRRHLHARLRCHGARQ